MKTLSLPGAAVWLIAALMSPAIANSQVPVINDPSIDPIAPHSSEPVGTSVPQAPSSAGHSLPRGHSDTPCCDLGGEERLLGLFARSDRCFSGFISPMTNPVHFEDPRTLTEARFIFLHHNVPSAAGDGSVQLFAVQFRAALTERLSIVAAKDGFVTSSNALIDDGWADLSVGLKYNLYKDYHRQRLLTAGLAFELPTGTPRTLQGNGDGVFHLYLTGGTQFWDCWHWISASGFRLPSNTNQESQVWYWSNHIDRRLGNSWYGLFEVNWYHWMKSGTGGVAGVEGVDLWNLGSTGVAGRDVVTMAAGLKWKPNDSTELGIAYEFPVTGREFILQNRLTVDFILRY